MEVVLFEACQGVVMIVNVKCVALTHLDCEGKFFEPTEKGRS
jgi:hypothetical protein